MLVNRKPGLGLVGLLAIAIGAAGRFRSAAASNRQYRGSKHNQPIDERNERAVIAAC